MTRLIDLFLMAGGALWQQKVRTLLTTLGVTFAGFVLVLSIATSIGVQDTISQEFRKHDRLRRIVIHEQRRAKEKDVPPELLEVKGNMSEEKRRRLRETVVQRWPVRWDEPPEKPLNQERLKMFAELPHVEKVKPILTSGGWALWNGEPEWAGTAAADPDSRQLRERLLEGDLFRSANERSVVVSEYLLHQWGISDDADVAQVVGKKTRLEFKPNQDIRVPGVQFNLWLNKRNNRLTREESDLLDKLRSQLPALLKQAILSPSEKDSLTALMQSEKEPTIQSTAETVAEDYTVVGVVRVATDEDGRIIWPDDASHRIDVFLPPETAESLFARFPDIKEKGYQTVVVIVDDEKHVKEVLRQIKDMGFSGDAMLEFIEQQQFLATILFGGMTGIAAVALLVSVLGISNTMLMSVLERTHEIGVMKAVGAGEGSIQMIFLLEGTIIGLLGGGLGLLFSWIASKPVDAWVRSVVSRELKVPLEESLFVFPMWLTIGVVLFCGIATTLAAAYPARQAARIDPITALRYE